MGNRFTKKLNIGCAGWSIPRAEKPLFAPSGSQLVRYSGVFQAFEINPSFYRPHRPTTYQRWRDSVGPEFRFSVKLPKAITHQARLTDIGCLLDGFFAECLQLQPKLGPLLVQLPPSLQFEARMTSEFWQDLRLRYAGPVVCEPRHASWFTDESDEVLRQFHIDRVAADPAGRTSGRLWASGLF